MLDVLCCYNWESLLRQSRTAHMVLMGTMTTYIGLRSTCILSTSKKRQPIGCMIVLFYKYEVIKAIHIVILWNVLYWLLALKLRCYETHCYTLVSQIQSTLHDIDATNQKVGRHEILERNWNRSLTRLSINSLNSTCCCNLARNKNTPLYKTIFSARNL